MARKLKKVTSLGRILLQEFVNKADPMTQEVLLSQRQYAKTIGSDEVTMNINVQHLVTSGFVTKLPERQSTYVVDLQKIEQEFRIVPMIPRSSVTLTLIQNIPFDK